MNLRDIITQCAARWDCFYLYDETCILKSISHLKSNFPQVEFLYSIKCNSNPHVLNAIFAQGFGADAAGANEVLLANKAGLSADRIYYSAPGKSMRDIEQSIDKAILIADSIDEIERIQTAAAQAGKTVNIGIRINPDFSFDGNGGKPSKFGIDEDQAIQLAGNNPHKNIRIAGLHIHLKSQELHTDRLLAYYPRVLMLAEKFAQLCGGLDFLNMGAGLGVPYAPSDIPLDMPRIGSEVRTRMKEFQTLWPHTKIFIEVGRYAVSKSGFYVTKVMDRKVSYGKTYLILKNTLNGFMRPSLAKLIQHYSNEAHPAGSEPLFTSVDAFEFLSLKEEAPSETVSLVGSLCTATDIIAEDILMPHLEWGDTVIITNAGGYAAVLSPFQFSSQEKPVELFLTQKGSLFLRKDL